MDDDVSDRDFAAGARRVLTVILYPLYPHLSHGGWKGELSRKMVRRAFKVHVRGDSRETDPYSIVEFPEQRLQAFLTAYTTDSQPRWPF